MASFKVNGNIVGEGGKTYFIADIAANHDGSLSKAIELIHMASEAGASAVKFQHFQAEKIVSEFGFESLGGKFSHQSKWKKSVHKIYKEAEVAHEWTSSLISAANDANVDFFSAPYDTESLELLASLNVPAYKVASFECTDLPLIQKIASTKKPIIVSTGMATISEISEAVEVIRDSGCENFALLKCTSTYPASPENTNLRTIDNMRKSFNCEVGLSDHTAGIGVSVAAISFGAAIIEKHFTLDRSDGGVDSSFSLEPNELKSLVIEADRAWRSLGSITYGPTKDERNSHLRRRSLYISKDMTEGEIFTDINLRRIRPGHGINPKYFDLFLGKRINQNAKKGTPVNWNLIG